MRLMICSILCLAISGLTDVRPASHAHYAQSDCQNVSGTVEAQTTGQSPACPVATIAGDVFDEAGIQIGTTTACIKELSQGEAGAIHAELTHSYSIGSLTFGTEDQGVLSPIDPPLYHFNNRLTIVTGASGFLRAHGTADLSSGQISLRFNGRICAGG